MLQGLDHALHLPLAPTVIRFAMEQAQPELGADQPSVAVDEGLALIGVKFAGQAAAEDRFLERVMKGLGVGVEIVGGERNQAGMIVNEDAELSGHALALDRESGAGREIDHPEVVDGGGFESLGGAGLEATGADAFAVVSALAEQTIENAQGREQTSGLGPVVIKDFEGDGGILCDLLKHPRGGGIIEDSVFTVIGTEGGLESGEAALFIGVPPVLQGADGVKVAGVIGPGADGGKAKRFREAVTSAELIFDEVDDLETGQSMDLGFGIWIWIRI